MTDAQWKVRVKQIAYESQWEDRAFRKKCVTQGIVTFGIEEGGTYYTVKYRDRYVTLLFGDKEDKLKLKAVWNVIRIAEQLIKEVEGVENESN